MSMSRRLDPRGLLPQRFDRAGCDAQVTAMISDVVRPRETGVTDERRRPAGELREGVRSPAGPWSEILYPRRWRNAHRVKIVTPFVRRPVVASRADPGRRRDRSGARLGGVRPIRV